MNCHEIGCMAPCFFPLDPHPPPPPKKVGAHMGIPHVKNSIKKVVEALRSCVCNDVSTVAHAVEFAPQGWYCSARETQWLICLGLVPLLHSFDMAFHATQETFVFFLNDGLDDRGFFCCWNQIWIQLFFKNIFSRHFSGWRLAFSPCFLSKSWMMSGFYRMIRFLDLIGLEMGGRLDLLG